MFLVSVVISEPAFASINNSLRRLLRFLLEYIGDHNGVTVDSVDNPPDLIRVNDSQLVTASSNRRHRPGMRHPYRIAPLKKPQQIAQSRYAPFVSSGAS